MEQNSSKLGGGEILASKHAGVLEEANLHQAENYLDDWWGVDSSRVKYSFDALVQGYPCKTTFLDETWLGSNIPLPEDDFPRSWEGVM